MMRLAIPLVFSCAALACGAPDEPPAPAGPDWSGTWRTQYTLDLSTVVSIPDAALDAHPFRAVWPEELELLRHFIEPVLEAWLWRSAPGELVAFFREVEAMRPHLSAARVLGQMSVTPSGDGWAAEERWEDVVIPDACGGAGLVGVLEGAHGSGGPLRLVPADDGWSWGFDRQRAVRSAEIERALLDAAAACVGALDGAQALIDDALRCEDMDVPSGLKEPARLACGALRLHWRARFAPADRPADTWRVGQSGWAPSPAGPVTGTRGSVVVQTSSGAVEGLAWRGARRG